MNFLDLVQFTNQLFHTVNNIHKLEYKYGLQFVSSPVMAAILDRFGECVEKLAARRDL